MNRLKVFFLYAVLSVSLSRTADAAVLDNGINPAKLGTGDWIYYLSSATNKLGANVESVTNIQSLMQFYRRSGLDYIVVKSGTGAVEFPESSPQFTEELVNIAHAAKLKIFGYTRSNGKNVPGEIALAIRNFELGADGFVIDAEAEWEESRLSNGPALAIELCQGIKAAYPNKFLGHSPFPIISYHSSFPYKEFGRYCDAVMPQAYWKSIGVSPVRMVEWMNEEWHRFHQTLQEEWKDAIKPLAPIGQGWSPDPDKLLHPEEIVEFIAALNDDNASPSPGGYKGVSYWRTDLHTAGMWRAIRKAKIGSESTSLAALAKREDKKSSLPENDESEVKPKKTPQASAVKHPHDGANDVVLDNTHPDVSVIGNWYHGKTKGIGYGTNYLCANSVSGDPTATAVYRPLIRNAGEYDIYIKYVAHPNRSQKAPWFVSYIDGSEIVPVDQTIQKEGWYLLATRKRFAPGTDGFISVSNDTGEKGRVIIADAIRLVRREDEQAGGGQ